MQMILCYTKKFIAKSVVRGFDYITFKVILLLSPKLVVSTTELVGFAHQLGCPKIVLDYMHIIYIYIYIYIYLFICIMCTSKMLKVYIGDHTSTKLSWSL